MNPITTRITAADKRYGVVLLPAEAGWLVYPEEISFQLKTCASATLLPSPSVP